MRTAWYCLKKRWHFFVLIFLSLTGLWLRVNNLSVNYSFWTDEDHVAIFSRAILERGAPVLSNGYSTGSFQSLWYWITAFSMKIFGINEFAARFPSVVFGVLTIGAVFLLTSKLFGRKVGLVSSFLTTFLNIEILWSRQARPYQAIQFIFLLEIYLFILILEAVDKKARWWPYFVLETALIIAGSLMHWFGLMPLAIFSSYFLIFRFKDIKTSANILLKRLKHKPFKWGGLILVFLVFLAVLLEKIGFYAAVKGAILPAYGKIGFYNHLGYYHSFLWRQYGMLVLLGLIGLLVALAKDFKRNSLVIFFLGVVIAFVNFRLRVPFSRYLYPVFSLLVILAAYGLSVISEAIEKSIPDTFKPFKRWVYLFLAVFLVANGYKFGLKPKPFYSLNADMQEIPEVDFKGLYKYISEKTGNDHEWVLVTTWADHATWYLGETKPEYWLRDKNVVYKEERDLLSGALILGNVTELDTVISSHPKGFVILESWEPYIPEGAEEYVKENLTKEIEVDRIYPVQPRYWPVNVYSWGF